MARLLNFLSVVLTVITFWNVSANVVVYSVTIVSCVPMSTCPQGNLVNFNLTFALNGALSPNLTLNIGDQLVFNLMTNVSIHPLAICQNSTVPSFCAGVPGNNLLNAPITLAGTNTSVSFNNIGTFYYGCFNHPGMGATINVVQPATITTAVMTSATAAVTTSATTNVTISSTTTRPNVGDKLAASLLFITVFASLVMIVL